MTAINVIRHADAVHVLTDGHGQSSDLAGPITIAKVFPLPHLNAVVAIRGPALGLGLVASTLGTARSYDDLKRSAHTLVRSVWIVHKELLARNPWTDFDLVIAGWSETTGPDSYMIINHRRHGQGVEPWKVAQMSECGSSPMNAEVQARWLSGMKEGVTANDLRPEVEGLALLELQRAEKWPPISSGVPFEISMRVLRRWQ